MPVIPTKPKSPARHPDVRLGIRYKSTKLLPCPFCGSALIRILPQEYGLSIDCIDCGAKRDCYSNYQQQAAAEWNRRPRTTKAVLTIEFDTPLAREHFAGWLCESGEPHYREYMVTREEETAGPITVTRFHYHGVEDPTNAQDNPKRHQKFLVDNIIRTTCGRLDADSDNTNEG